MLKSRIPVIAAELDSLTRAALEEGAEVIARRAKHRAPVGDRAPHIRDAIHTESEPEGVYVIAGDNDTFYGHILEHGSVKMPAQPFLLPALEESKKDVLGLVKRALKQAV